MTFLLLPGRQIVNTRFQEEYVSAIAGRALSELPELLGDAPAGAVMDLVFAVTSCNKSNSRYNPLPFEIRAVLVYEFARRFRREFGIRFHIVGIPHYPPNDRFAALVLKEIAAQNGLELSPSNCVVFTSTPAIIRAYRQLNFAVLPGEYAPSSNTFTAPVPNDVVQQIGAGVLSLYDIPLSRSAREVFDNFPDAVARIRTIFHDPILTESGDLTETRDYATYTRAMADVIERKWEEIRPFVVPGKIVDEGCADGALMERMVKDDPDSDYIGVDLSAEMLARGRESQRAGAFGGAFVFFKQQNLMTPVSDAQTSSVDTIICNSTLHELWSYGERAKTVRAYLRAKFRQLRAGGRLVIRDVVGPDEGEKVVRLRCLNDETRELFGRFARDFMGNGFACDYETVGGDIRFSLRTAMEFVAKHAYTDNWQSEMHEEFCFWDFGQWTDEMRAAGFVVLPGSQASVSEWRVTHHFAPHVQLFNDDGTPLPFPVTNMVLAGEKPAGA